MTIKRSATRDAAPASPDARVVRLTEDDRTATAREPSAEVLVTAAQASERRACALAFVKAAVALAHVASSSDEEREEATIAAAALVRLAELGAHAALAEALRPDPNECKVIWTVACYQIGDLIPCALRDYTDAAVAVAALADCPELNHVAAELIASTDTGLRWSALMRTGEQVTFQPLSATSATSETGEEADAVEVALEHWRNRLAEWSASEPTEALGEAGDEPTPQHPEPNATTEEFARLLTVLQTIQARLGARDELVDELRTLLASIDSRLGALELALTERATTMSEHPVSEKLATADATAFAPAAQTIGPVDARVVEKPAGASTPQRARTRTPRGSRTGSPRS